MRVQSAMKRSRLTPPSVPQPSVLSDTPPWSYQSPVGLLGEAGRIEPLVGVVVEDDAHSGGAGRSDGAIDVGGIRVDAAMPAMRTGLPLASTMSRPSSRADRAAASRAA
jgi:hypothetical protein